MNQNALLALAASAGIELMGWMPPPVGIGV